MPFKDSEQHLRDILESVDQINKFIDDMTFTTYQQDEKTKAAVERKLQILTEAVIRLENDGTDAYPGIDWRHTRAWATFCDIRTNASLTK